MFPPQDRYHYPRLVNSGIPTGLDVTPPPHSEACIGIFVVLDAVFANDKGLTLVRKTAIHENGTADGGLRVLAASKQYTSSALDM